VERVVRRRDKSGSVMKLDASIAIVIFVRERLIDLKLLQLKRL